MDDEDDDYYEEPAGDNNKRPSKQISLFGFVESQLATDKFDKKESINLSDQMENISLDSKSRYENRGSRGGRKYENTHRNGIPANDYDNFPAVGDADMHAQRGGGSGRSRGNSRSFNSHEFTNTRRSHHQRSGDDYERETSSRGKDTNDGVRTLYESNSQKGSYADRRNYSNGRSRGGYSNSRGGDAREGRGRSPRGGYSNEGGNYSNTQRGYSDARGGYSSSRDNHSEGRAEYTSNRGRGFSDDRGGYGDRRGDSYSKLGSNPAEGRNYRSAPPNDYKSYTSDTAYFGDYKQRDSITNFNRGVSHNRSYENYRGRDSSFRESHGARSDYMHTTDPRSNSYSIGNGGYSNDSAYGGSGSYEFSNSTYGSSNRGRGRSPQYENSGQNMSGRGSSARNYPEPTSEVPFHGHSRVFYASRSSRGQ